MLVNCITKSIPFILFALAAELGIKSCYLVVSSSAYPPPPPPASPWVLQIFLIIEQFDKPPMLRKKDVFKCSKVILCVCLG